MSEPPERIISRNLKKPFLLFLKRAAVFLLGIVIPVVSFVLSDVLKPEAKDGASFGFLSLLVSSKIILSPLVLWAIVAFFRTQIYPRKELRQWETIGLCLGTIVAVFSLASGLLSMGIELLWAGPGMLIFPFVEDSRRISASEIAYLIPFVLLAFAPLYTPIWYGLAAWNALRKKKEQAESNVGIAAIISLPFMGAALVYAQRLYDALPDMSSGCYVASATALTPLPFVRTIPHPLTGRPVSRQLLIFKAFEYAWMASAHASHAIFRTVYNIVGPILARAIRIHPLFATIAYITMKPAEYVAWKFLQQYQVAHPPLKTFDEAHEGVSSCQ